jgi:hypothetical protein
MASLGEALCSIIAPLGEALCSIIAPLGDALSSIIAALGEGAVLAAGAVHAAAKAASRTSVPSAAIRRSVGGREVMVRLLAGGQARQAGGRP